MDFEVVLVAIGFATFFCLLSFHWLYNFFKDSEDKVSVLVLKKLKEKVSKAKTPPQLFSAIDKTIAMWFELKEGKNNSETNIIIAGALLVILSIVYSFTQDISGAISDLSAIGAILSGIFIVMVFFSAFSSKKIIERFLEENK